VSSSTLNGRRDLSNGTYYTCSKKGHFWHNYPDGKKKGDAGEEHEEKHEEKRDDKRDKGRTTSRNSTDNYGDAFYINRISKSPLKYHQRMVEKFIRSLMMGWWNILGRLRWCHGKGSRWHKGDT